jgi:hypothetical protein
MRKMKARDSHSVLFPEGKQLIDNSSKFKLQFRHSVSKIP